VEETQLTEIENRLGGYPVQAQHDILQLTRELRRFYKAAGGNKPQQAVSHLYDPLTGLLNAGAYGVRFAMARARATRYRKIFAVMSVDLTTQAQDAGAARPSASAHDRSIRQIAERLETCVRATDTLARIGDDNFAIILEDLTQPGQAERVQQHVQDTVNAALAEEADAPALDVDVRIQFYPAPQQPAAEVDYRS
jgi:diguanylate cyclase (GGDEF)-like protein